MSCCSCTLSSIRCVFGFLCGLILFFSSIGLLLPLCIISWILGKIVSPCYPQSSVVAEMVECGWKLITVPCRIFMCCLGFEDNKKSNYIDENERSLAGYASNVNAPPHVAIQMFRDGLNSPTLPPPVPKRQSRQKPAASNTISFGLNFRFEELMAASNNLSEENLIGRGGFSRVYKGILSDGRQIAIKQLKDTDAMSISSFQEEARIISLLHHRNLVSLIGCCITEVQRLIVYEFVPNGTVSFHLHGNEKTALEWPKRYKIALGTAKGLAYLHEDCQPRVIHRDVKADNILLDNSFEAKIADLGIAKNIPDDRSHISTRAMGTFGYLDPEYLSNGQLTDKSDVFSFGVVLLELITGRKPIGLADWARPLLTQALDDENYTAIADQLLKSDYNLHEMGKMVACANACIQRSAALRPNMSQVVRDLERLQH